MYACTICITDAYGFSGEVVLLLCFNINVVAVYYGARDRLITMALAHCVSAL